MEEWLSHIGTVQEIVARVRMDADKSVHKMASREVTCPICGDGLYVAVKPGDPLFLVCKTAGCLISDSKAAFINFYH